MRKMVVTGFIAVMALCNVASHVHGQNIQETRLLVNRATENVQQELVPYKGAVEHIFFHPLIAYPERAFDGDRMAKGYNDWFVTTKEFNKIIETLYQRDYILVDIQSLFEEKINNEKIEVVNKTLLLPKGKKPLVISIDDLNYYDYMLANGNVSKLILDQKGNVATYSVDSKGKGVVSYENEIIPLLDRFVEQHPDFSHQGAKATIALTGYQGILGYRTNLLGSPQYAAEKEKALAVVRRLKETGWSFASHGYGHLDARKVSLKRLMDDTEQWKREVETLIGHTPVYIYPYGSRVDTDSDKYRYLVKAGFTALCSVGPAPYSKYKQDSFMMDRRHIDGIALQTQRDKLLPLFDAAEVIDPVRAQP
ncbi:polysaccharide deacetylase family protein [Brevibacillus migulae]|uniref:polysaccharide deacetylase family protein n=1 Tax=Brevibacillus migulae TaxID=1644114 RepID=UPI001F2857BB|nr:polysaccharide deacetylase family protein [Brevibacillus migulae]